MSIFKCKMCGGTLEINDNQTTATCEYCGTEQTLPKSSDEIMHNLFNRANNLRLKGEFDKAEEIYEKIVATDNSDSEAYWGIVLCKYGIEYIEDPKTFKRVPTCHRTQIESVLTDVDYQSAIEHADSAQRNIYCSEAFEIDRLQKDILKIASKEKPFDIFICYKESDEQGKRTPDSVFANDIYHQLTLEGFKVFYSAITLEDKLGQEYEPYIFSALNSAKVMLVIGSKPEYFNAVWVKNEWSRFLKIVKNDRTKLLIPCYKDMDAYDLPEEFSHLQAQDMGKIGFINDVVRGIKKVVSNESSIVHTAEPVRATATAPVNIAPLLERAFMYLEDKEWASANDYCEKVLDQDPKNAEAYLGKLMAELKCSKTEHLKNQAKPFDGSNNYQKVLRFADSKLKDTLVGYIEHINNRNENARLESIYSQAKQAMSSARIDLEYKKAAQLFSSIREYQDSAALEKECLKKAEIARKDAILSYAKSAMTGESIPSFEDAIKLFESIPGWKDADEQNHICKKKIEEIKKKAEADRLERERKAKIAQIEAEKRAKRNKKITVIILAIILACIGFIIALNNLIIPTYKYNHAKSLIEEGKTVDAYKTLVSLDDFKDSTIIAEKLISENSDLKIYVSKAGDIINFGSYEQDNKTSNGKESIEWIVLAREDNRVLVISKYGLDCKPYNNSLTEVTWKTSSLRKWLNNDFINNAFSRDEKAMIPTVKVSADRNPEYNTTPGKTTRDKIFLLSITETNNYFNSDSERPCKATAYAKAQGAQISKSNGNCWWWLRSLAYSKNCAAFVYTNGVVDENGFAVNHNIGAVRPALWINF